MIELILFGVFNLAVIRFWKAKRKTTAWILCSLWIGTCLIALFLPDGILASSTVIEKAIRFLSIFLPAERFSRNAEFRDVAVIYYSVALLGFPFLCMWISDSLKNSPKRGVLHLDSREFGAKQYVFCTFAALFFIFFFCVWWFLFGGGNTRFFQIGTSRLVLGLWGMFLIYTAAALITMAVLCIKKMFFGYCWTGK